MQGFSMYIFAEWYFYLSKGSDYFVHRCLNCKYVSLVKMEVKLEESANGKQPFFVQAE